MEWEQGIYGVWFAHTEKQMYSVSINGLGQPWYKIAFVECKECKSIEEGMRICEEYEKSLPEIPHQ